MIVDANTMDALAEFWRTVANENFWKDTVDVEFDCHDENCLYSVMCKKSCNHRQIGKWCPHYCEKLVEILQKESNDDEK